MVVIRRATAIELISAIFNAGPLKLEGKTFFNWAVGEADELEMHVHRGSFAVNLYKVIRYSEV